MAELMDTLNQLLEQQTGQTSTRIGGGGLMDSIGDLFGKKDR